MIRKIKQRVKKTTSMRRPQSGNGVRRNHHPSASVLAPDSRNFVHFNDRQAGKSALSLFLSELISNPRNIGAACPSSNGLANCMASFVPRAEDGYIIELGAGTGTITAAILRQGIDPKRLVVVEKSAKMAEFLKHRFPEILVIHGDAAERSYYLDSHFGAGQWHVSTIVSSLPFKSLPVSVGDAIKEQFQQVLPPRGRLIQFTYDIRPVSAHYFTNFKKKNSRIKWINIPPARVDVFLREKQKN